MRSDGLYSSQRAAATMMPPEAHQDSFGSGPSAVGDQDGPMLAVEVTARKRSSSRALLRS